MKKRSIRQAQDKSYWLGFSQVPNVGPTRFTQLLAAFGTAKAAWNATEKELLPVIKPALTKQFLDFRETFSIEAYEEKLRRKNCWYLTLDDPDYPQLLKEAKNAPFVLFYIGQFPFNTLENKTTIGIVGTRKITDYGGQVTEMLTEELVSAGCVIVSGLALGVDAVAHQTTITHGGKTIAVLGCGVDCCSPSENEQLYDRIVESGGCIVSEYGLGMSPTVGSFPSRNRIIAGLSLGVLVTEGAVDSGALITAKDAFENNRKVFAVPGPVTSSLSKGPYDLIKKGAVVVSSGKEILDELGLQNKKRANQKRIISGDTKEEQKIIDLLAEQDLHFDELVRRTKIDSSQLGTILSMMEMKGMIKTLHAGFFSLTQQ
jgi:DNA processing protein